MTAELVLHPLCCSCCDRLAAAERAALVKDQAIDSLTAERDKLLRSAVALVDGYEKAYSGTSDEDREIIRDLHDSGQWRDEARKKRTDLNSGGSK